MTTIKTKTEAISLAEVKELVNANLGSPQSNQNAATALAGTRFFAENAKGIKVLGVVLPELSAKGKVQAELECSIDGCEETHIREMSDWHQSVNCRTHAVARKARLTDDEKAARQLSRAQAVVAKLTGGAGKRT